MSASTLFALALLALAFAVVVFALGVFARHRSGQQQSQVMERALQHQPLALGEGERDARSAWQRLLDAVQAVGRRFEHGGLGKALLAPEDRLMLDQANRNTPAGRATYLGVRLLLALLLPVAVALWLRPTGIRGLIELIAGLAAGVLLPKFVLSAWAERLRRQATDELPLLIDLLRLFQGVGFSMDQSLQTIAERFPTVLPVLGHELRDANTAYMHGRPREQSLRRLAESFDNDDLRSLVQIIVQVHEHGGAVQEPLRQFADRLREQRKMTMKEKTGKLSVKMTVVMMLTLLPALMLVLAGPAIVSLIGTMSKLGGH
jgi:tight adherence protein C